jgi:AraC-like DNA-binding protein
VDLITYTIDRIGLKGQIMCRARGYAPWGLEVAADFHVPFYLVEAGGGWLIIENMSPIRLNQGDLVFLPNGSHHRLVDDPSSLSTSLIQWTPVSTSSLCPFRQWKGEGMESQFLCGVYRLDPHMFTEIVLDDLPVYIRLSTHEQDVRSHIDPVLGLLLMELERHDIGSDQCIQYMLDLFLVRMLRAWMKKNPGHHLGWFNAARHAKISEAIALFFQSPQDPWTVASIAEEVDLSRATFAREFQRLVGQTPLAFLTQLRMKLATKYLTLDGESVAEVGERVGYKSEPAFTRAFKKHFGVPPGQYRHQTRSSHIPSVLTSYLKQSVSHLS